MRGIPRELLAALDAAEALYLRGGTAEVAQAAAHRAAAANLAEDNPELYDPAVNVVGVGIGYDKGASKEHELHVFVERRPPPKVRVPAKFRIEKSILKVPVRVVETGPIIAQPSGASTRHGGAQRTVCAHKCEHGNPIPCGVSIGHPQTTAGTLGAIVVRTDDPGGRRYILSNRHVLTHPAATSLVAGDDVLFPGPLDQGTNQGTVVAKLVAQSALDLQGTHRVDCAIAELQTGNAIQFSPEICGIGRIAGRTAAVFGTPVKKHGRTTNLTVGNIVSVNARIWVQYPSGRYYFEDQIVIESGTTAPPFAEPGDSGSIVVDFQGNAIGLLFATSSVGANEAKARAYANPIDGVFDELVTAGAAAFSFA